MRIRKRLIISSPPVSPLQIVPNSPEINDCEVNRSLWDVVPLHKLESDYAYQAEKEDEYTFHTSGKESVYTSNSKTASSYGNDLMKKKKKKVDREEVIDEMEEEIETWRPYERKKGVQKKIQVFDFVQCAKTDGKGWQCKKEAHQGQSLCKHHFVLPQSYAKRCNNTSKRKGKSSTTKKKNSGSISASSSSNYYYYSGLGPYKSKTRGEGGEGEIVGGETMKEDEQHFDANSSEKRIRKIIKARSLKSLL